MLVLIRSLSSILVLQLFSIWLWIFLVLITLFSTFVLVSHHTIFSVLVHCPRLLRLWMFSALISVLITVLVLAFGYCPYSLPLQPLNPRLCPVKPRWLLTVSKLVVFGSDILIILAPILIPKTIFELGTKKFSSPKVIFHPVSLFVSRKSPLNCRLWRSQ